MPLPRCLIATLCLAGCAGGEASHIPNPLLLPGQAVATGLENAVYNSRRARVKAHVEANLAALEREIAAGGGPLLDDAMALAGVPAATQPGLTARLADDLPLYRGDAEALTVALMVHGG